MDRNCMVIIACLALPLIFSGCTLKDQNGAEIGVGEIVGSHDLTVSKYLNDTDLICREAPGSKPCYCMACANKTSYGFLGLGWLVGYYDSNLQGGNCSVSVCNTTDYLNIVQSDNSTQMRSFMMGMGQSFVSTGNANLYCNYTMQLATKWMKGAAGAPPRVPQVSRAVCWLQRNSLPLYIYYTEGKAIDPLRTREIAGAFQDADAGPAILTTEVWLNSSSDTDVANVEQQIYALRTCEKCMVVLAVKPNDYNATYRILGVPGAFSQYNAMIDAVGFGFRANDYPYCDTDRIIYENLNFSRYILKKYGKPTIWLYAGASEGNSSDGSCQWDGGMVNGFYQELMSHTSGLASSGVLGMGFYEFVDGSGSLPCNGVQGCDFGVMSTNGSQKHPVMNTWSDMCQQIGTDSEYRTPLIFSKNGQGSACEMMRNEEAAMYSALRINSGQAAQVKEVVPTAKIQKLGCGEACPAETSMPSVYDGTASGFDSGHCDSYPIIDERADDADISASYMRAEFEQESGFDLKAVSNVSSGNGNCNAKGYSILQICNLSGIAPADCPAFNHPAGQKPCAYGLAQCIEYPGKAYTDENQYGKVIVPDPGNMPLAIANCGGAKYNPFDAGMSACCGVNKLSQALRGDTGSTEKWVDSNWAQLSKCSGGMKAEEKGWAAYYLASERYFGMQPATPALLSAFVSQRDANGECCANAGGSTCYQHYIAYLRSLSTPPAPGMNYGAQVMSRYKDVVSECASECPG